MNIQVEITQDIPLPANAGKRGRTGIYPFKSMTVGSSFSIPDSADQKRPDGGSMAQGKLASAARNWARSHNSKAKFCTRVLVEDGKPVARIWRIA